MFIGWFWLCLFDEFMDDVDEDRDDEAVSGLYTGHCGVVCCLGRKEPGDVAFIMPPEQLLEILRVFSWLHVGHLSTVVTGCIVTRFEIGAEQAMF